MTLKLRTKRRVKSILKGNQRGTGKSLWRRLCVLLAIQLSSLKTGIDTQSRIALIQHMYAPTEVLLNTHHYVYIYRR